ncbi:UDP-2,3-diacylglucosamine diphosphatase [Muriicola sp. SD30]|uniref:UDP-2,3-diacylglucosamine diphosphatase n=1 Tax=Muriicola sp. SD30 TaxID=3240936 RepID=UPI0035100198
MKKRKPEVVVISDINLGTVECRAEELLVYLSSIKPKILVLNGDIYGNAENTSTKFPCSHIKVIKKLLSMYSDGTKIFYLKGDKDKLFRRSNSRTFGDFTIDKELVLDLDGKKTWILHGDVFNTNLNLAKWINPFRDKKSDLLNPKVFAEKQRAKGNSRMVVSQIHKLSSEYEDASELMDQMELKAVNKAIKKGVDTVICGHNHQPVKSIHESRKGQCKYLNSGDWVKHLTALEYSFKRWKLYSFKLDKLTAFYGDEDLKSLSQSQVAQNYWDQIGNTENPRTAS